MMEEGRIRNLSNKDHVGMLLHITYILRRRYLSNQILFQFLSAAANKRIVAKDLHSLKKRRSVSNAHVLSYFH